MLTSDLAVIRSIHINMYFRITHTALQTKKPDGKGYSAPELQRLHPWLRSQFANLVKLYGRGTGLFKMHDLLLYNF